MTTVYEEIVDRAKVIADEYLPEVIDSKLLRSAVMSAYIRGYSDGLKKQEEDEE